LCDWRVVGVVVERQEVELSDEARGVVLHWSEYLLLPDVVGAVAGVPCCGSAGVEKGIVLWVG